MLAFAKLPWKQPLSWLLDALSPPVCSACDRATSSGAFCTACGHASSVEDAELDGAPLLVAGRYEPPLSTAIIRFKFENRPELARPLAQLLAPRLLALSLPAGVVLAPVPLHPRRLVTRGYNQSALLARELSARCGLACRPRLLERVRDTAHQVGKSRGERAQNAADSFALRQPDARRVLLVDDVVTTGATVRACAQALIAGGIELAGVVALAQAGAR